MSLTVLQVENIIFIYMFNSLFTAYFLYDD